MATTMMSEYCGRIGLLVGIGCSLLIVGSIVVGTVVGGEWDVVAHSRSPDIPNYFITEVFVSDLRVGLDRQLTDLQLWSDHLSWSPDGKHIVFDAMWIETADLTLHTVELQTGIIRRPFGFGDIGYPAWSPDGLSMAFVAPDESNSFRQLHVATMDGAPPRKLTDTRAFVYDPVWSPDGTRLAFYVQSRRGVLIVDTADPQAIPQQLVSVDGNVSQPAWSPDGTHLTFRVQGRAPGIYYVDIRAATIDSPAEALRLTESPTHNFPTWSRDGQSVVYFAQRDAINAVAYDEVYRHHLLSNTVELLYSFPRGGFVSPAWRP